MGFRRSIVSIKPSLRAWLGWTYHRLAELLYFPVQTAYTFHIPCSLQIFTFNPMNTAAHI